MGGNQIFPSVSYTKPLSLIEIMSKKPAKRLGAKAANWRGGKSYSGPYRTIYRPEHPRASKHGHVPEHILLVEEALGAFLPAHVVVHHADGNPANNSLS